MANYAQVIARRHPEYANMKPKWDFLLESYESDLPDYAEKHLEQFYREGPEEFKARKKRAERENHSKRIILILNSYLFSGEQVRTFKNKRFEEWCKNVDGKGTDIFDFEKKVDLYASILGRVYVVLDKPSIDNPTGTALDNLKAEPYAYVVHPQNVLDVKLDSSGNVLWAMILETYRDDSDPFSIDDTGEKQRYRIWRGGFYYLLDDEGNVAESNDELFNGVEVRSANNQKLAEAPTPVIVVDSAERSEYSGLSAIADIAYIDKSIFNCWSLLDTILVEHTFSQLLYPVEALPIAAIATNTELRAQLMTIARDRYLLWSSQNSGGVAPTWISPDANQAKTLLEVIGQKTAAMYAILGLAGEVTQEVKEMSGKAKSHDFDKINRLLISRASRMEDFERKLANQYAHQIEVPEFEHSVTYPDTFDTRSITDDITEAQGFESVNMPAIVKAKLMKGIVQKKFPYLDEAEKDEIFAQIDEITTKPPEEEDPLGFGKK